MDEAVEIYTDGACKGNPGPGGYGVVLLSGGRRKELSGGFRKTTNNRMELLACIEGLRSLKRPCTVVLTSDSKYVVEAMNKGWAKRWRSNGWAGNFPRPNRRKIPIFGGSSLIYAAATRSVLNGCRGTTAIPKTSVAMCWPWRHRS